MRKCDLLVSPILLREMGFAANMFVSHLSLDIDECEESHPCPGSCINIPGSFKCVDGRKKATFILIGKYIF